MGGYFKVQCVKAEVLPLWSHLVEDDVLINKNPVGNKQVLLQVEEVVVTQPSFGLFPFRLLFLSEVMHILGPRRELAKARNRISLAISSHVSHLISPFN